MEQTKTLKQEMTSEKGEFLLLHYLMLYCVCLIVNLIPAPTKVISFMSTLEIK